MCQSIFYVLPARGIFWQCKQRKGDRNRDWHRDTWEAQRQKETPRHREKVHYQMPSVSSANNSCESLAGWRSKTDLQVKMSMGRGLIAVKRDLGHGNTEVLSYHWHHVEALLYQHQGERDSSAFSIVKGTMSTEQLTVKCYTLLNVKCYRATYSKVLQNNLQ